MVSDSTVTKTMGVRLASLIIIACMLLCAVSPAIVDWNEDFVFGEDDTTDPEFNYVSIGASNTNGFGLRGYINEDDIAAILEAAIGGSGDGQSAKSSVNQYGYGISPEGSYPDLIRDHFVEEGYDVDLTQLAMSSMRVEEVRILLDENYYGDNYSEWRFVGEDKWFDSAGGIDALRLNYANSITNADLITLDIGWNNFGVYVSHQLTSYLDGDGPDFTTDLGDIFENESDLNTAIKVKEIIRDCIANILGADIEIVGVLTDIFAYSILGYIYNFDKVMERILQLNPDANIVSIGIQNLMHGIVLNMGDTLVPLGDLFGAIVNIANYYISSFSPYKDEYLFVMPGENGHVNLFLDSMKDYDGNPGGLDQNVKDCFDYYDDDLYIHSTAARLVSFMILDIKDPSEEDLAYAKTFVRLCEDGHLTDIEGLLEDLTPEELESLKIILTSGELEFVGEVVSAIKTFSPEELDAMLDNLEGNQRAMAESIVDSNAMFNFLNYALDELEIDELTLVANYINDFMGTEILGTVLETIDTLIDENILSVIREELSKESPNYNSMGETGTFLQNLPEEERALVEAIILSDNLFAALQIAYTELTIEQHGSITDVNNIDNDPIDEILKFIEQMGEIEINAFGTIVGLYSCEELGGLQREYITKSTAAANAAYDTLAEIVKAVANQDYLNTDGIDLQSIDETENLLKGRLWTKIEAYAAAAIDNTNPDEKGYVVDLSDLIFDSTSEAFVTLYIRTVVGNSFFAHPDETGHRQICDAVLHILENPETEIDEILKLNGVDNFIAYVQDKLIEIDGYIDELIDSPEAAELEVRMDAFVLSCNAVLEAAMTGSPEEVEAALADMHAAFDYLKAYIEELALRIVNDPKFMEFYDAVLDTMSMIEDAIPTIELVVTEILESEEWALITHEIELAIEDLKEAFLDSEYYAEIVELADRIKAEVEAKYQEFLDAVESGIADAEKAYEEFMAALDEAIAEIEEYIDEIEQYVDSKIIEVMERVTEVLDDAKQIAESIIVKVKEVISSVEDIVASLYWDITSFDLDEAIEELKEAFQDSEYYEQIVELADLIKEEIEDKYQAFLDALESGMAEAEMAYDELMAALDEAMADIVAFITELGQDIDTKILETVDIVKEILSEIRFEIGSIMTQIEEAMSSVEEIVDSLYQKVVDFNLQDAIEKMKEAFLDSEYYAEAVELADRIKADINAAYQAFMEAVESGMLDIEMTYEEFLAALDEALADIDEFIDSIEQYVDAKVLEAVETVWEIIYDIRETMESLISEIEIVFPAIEDIIDSIRWDIICFDFEDVLEDLKEAFLDSEFYVQAVELANDIKENFEARYAAFIEAVESGRMDAELAYQELMAALDEMMADIDAFVTELGEDIDATIAIAIEAVTEMIEEVRQTVESIMTQIEEASARIAEIVDGIREFVTEAKIAIDEFQAYIADMTDRIREAIDAADIPGTIEEIKAIIEEYRVNLEAYLHEIGLEIYDRIMIELQALESFVEYVHAVIVDLATYEETDGSYYESDGILYIGSGYGKELFRDLEYISIMLEEDESLMKEVSKHNVIVVETDSNNILEFILYYLPYLEEDWAELPTIDFDEFVDINGVNVAYLMSQIETYVGPVVEWVLEEYPEYRDAAEVIEFLASALLHQYLSSLDSMDDVLDSILNINDRATVLFGGAFNAFAGIVIEYEDTSIPLGNITDVLVKAFNVCIYQFCEDAPRAIYMDTYELTPEGIVIDLDEIEEIDESFIDTIMERFQPDKEILAGIVDATLGNLTEIPLYDVTWVNFDGTVLDKDVGLLDVSEATYDGATPVRADSETSTFAFTGEWSCETLENGDLVYTALYEETVIKTIIDKIVDGKATIDITKIGDDVKTVEIVDSGWKVTIPMEILAGASTAEMTMRFMDLQNVPANLYDFIGDKKVILLELFLDGKEISDFNGLSIRIAFQYVPDVGEDMSTIALWYMDEDRMELVEFPVTFDAATNTLTMETTHFSYWFVGHKEVAESNDGMTVAIAVILVVILCMCGGLLRMKR